MLSSVAAIDTCRHTGKSKGQNQNIVHKNDLAFGFFSFLFCAVLCFSSQK